MFINIQESNSEFSGYFMILVLSTSTNNEVLSKFKVHDFHHFHNFKQLF